MQKATTDEPGRESSPESDHASTLISDYQTPNYEKINFFCLSHPVYVTMAYQVDKDSCLSFLNHLIEKRMIIML